MRGLMAAVAAVAAVTAAASEEWPPYFVGEVVVVGQAGEDGPGPGTVSVLDADDIERLGATTVAEAVQHLAGATMSVGSRNEQRVWVRGYDPSAVLVLLDGIPIADPYSGEVDLGQIPVAGVARLVLTRGAAAPAYGPGGMGGVLNIVSVQGAGAPGIDADVAATDHDTVRAHAATGGAAAAVDWYVGAGYETSDGWPLSGGFEPTIWEDGGRRENSDLERWSATARVGARFGDAGRLTATLRFIDADKGIPFSTERPAGFVRFARFPEWRQDTAALGWEGGFGDRASLRAQLYAHGFDNTLATFADPDLSRLQLESTFDDDVLGGWAVSDTVLGRHSLTFALHLSDDRHERLEAAPGAPAERTERYRVRTGSVSLQDRLPLGGWATLTVSASLGHQGVVDAWQAASGDGETSSSTELSPQAELDLRLGKDLSGSFAVYRRTGFPTLRQRYSIDAPNPELGPQRSTGATAGLHWRPGPASELAASLYADRVDDLITRVGRNVPYENQEQAELAGLEVSARRTWGRVDLGFEGALLHAELVESSLGIDEVPLVPDATVDLDLGVAVGGTGDLRLHWTWVGRRVWVDGPTRAVLEPYDLVRASFAWRWPALELELALDNALDADVEPEWGYPLAGRRLWASLHVRR